MLLQMGFLKCDNITQASQVRIKTKKITPMQIDGEPVLMEPVNIEIKLKNQVSMIQADRTLTSCFC
jgi:diacylglycerol kinase family enzyme